MADTSTVAEPKVTSLGYGVYINVLHSDGQKQWKIWTRSHTDGFIVTGSFFHALLDYLRLPAKVQNETPTQLPDNIAIAIRNEGDGDMEPREWVTRQTAGIDPKKQYSIYWLESTFLQLIKYLETYHKEVL